MPSGLVPVLRSQGRRTIGPSLRFNPKNGVATLSLEAWKRLGQPETVGIYTNPDNSRIFLVGNPENERAARKISAKRTFTASFLRGFVNGGSGSTKWDVDFPEETNLGVVNVGENERE